MGEVPEVQVCRITAFGWWFLCIIFQVTGLHTRPFQLTVEKLEMAMQGANSEVWGSNQSQGWEWVGLSRSWTSCGWSPPASRVSPL